MIKYENGTKDVFNEMTKDEEIIISEMVTKPYDSPPEYLEFRREIRLNNVILSNEEVRNLFVEYPDPLKYYNQGESFKLIGSIFQWSVIGVGVYVIIKGRSLDPPESEVLAKRGLLTMAGLAAGYITFNLVGRQMKKKAVKSYNASIQYSTSYNFQFFIKENQVGLAMRF
jgi:hypothetical protein